MQLNSIERELEIEMNEKNQDDIKKIIAFIKSNSEKDKNGLLDKAGRTLGKLTDEIVRHQADRESLLAEMSIAEHAKIVVEQTLCHGVEIRIGDQIWKA